MIYIAGATQWSKHATSTQCWFIVVPAPGPRLNQHLFNGIAGIVTEKQLMKSLRTTRPKRDGEKYWNENKVLIPTHYDKVRDHHGDYSSDHHSSKESKYQRKEMRTFLSSHAFRKKKSQKKGFIFRSILVFFTTCPSTSEHTRYQSMGSVFTRSIAWKSQ